MKPGKLVVITAPSGAGKTTIARHLLNSVPGLAFSISASTRKIRPEEVEGRDYFFMSDNEFKKRVDRGEFIEWEEVYHGSFYGTLKSEVEKIWKEGKAALFDVDVEGALKLKKQFPENTLTILIKPPTFKILIDRLHSRATEPPEKIEERIRKAEYELQFENSFDVAIVNDDLEKAFRESEAAVRKFLHT